MARVIESTWESSKLGEATPRETTEAFRPRACLLQILGDQLIGSPPADWTPLFRIRQQLLTVIVAHAAEYQTHPGVVKLPE
ncbi:hypothetical protein [Methylorubrum thiocyanatum]|uniref:hypothetical protein n=1 Tax=Methylorubrum thiocyanatum TaxID=47958 RepID=UPI003648F79B